ncbi:hypothetical protein FF38_02401 [Lucilia cuprina]|uniref:Uncharacterized protein n=1 Tax=Lucilia cuprina TaxID=7375 RepID=A0A0L0CCW6_LUCCU|nr:Inner centromere protein [Lucilia cuprina]KNC29304.1 hypothetical protein FF38_02401 [Lucilia cuprina]
MEDLNNLLQLTETYPMQLEQMTEEFLLKLRVILWGQAAVTTANKEKLKDLPVASPQQTKKRIKRLTSLCEDNETEEKIQEQAPAHTNDKKSLSRKSKRSNAELLASAEAIENAIKENEVEAPVPAPRKLDATIATNVEDKENVAANENINSNATDLMPPPPAPTASSADDTLNRRPQRAAKLKSEKNLKEPNLHKKLRRPTIDEVKIKLEHEQRASQMHEATINTTATVQHTSSAVSGNETIVKDSLSSQKSDDSVVVLPSKQPSIVSVNSDIEDVPSIANANDNTKEKKKSTESTESEIREIRIKIKREKVSLCNQEELPPTESPSDESVFKAPNALPLPMAFSKNETTTTMEETSMASSILSSTTNTTTAAPAKKGRKKKDVVHKPIKVERFSDLDPKPSPIASRTRQGSLGRSENMETSPTKESKRPASIYEDAVETPPSRNSKETSNATITVTGGIVNETVNLGPGNDATMNLGPIPGDATFCTNPAQTTFQVAPGQTTFVMDSNPNSTVTLNKLSGAGAPGDVTFDVNQVTKSTKDDDAIGQRSFETAKDSSIPNDDDSLLTEEDEQEKPILPPKPKVSTASAKSKSKGAAKTSTSAKAAGYKMPTRTNELFNPLAQSPVKMRVEAFENAAAAATEQSKRPLRTKKENVTPTSATTPVIGKLPAPALGRFLTPTQSSNIATVNSAIAKKGPTSASKALPMPKSASASSLQRSNSTASTKTLQRENSADDFRKGLHNLAEERKKQREQKHLLAAQQREAKERERAERMAKLAKEREEKRQLKKQQEQEQKKRELEEIQRKLRQQQEEEAAKLKAAKEREMLMQMKQQQLLAKQRMMPPPPKTSSKYTFEMLHEDDSTDDEDKVSYKRPPPPTWSRSHVRGPFMLKQEYIPSAIIDSFFSVQPMTPDLKIIFPNIDARHLKRNSSAVWSTPPRYSELPKY